jgi:hypothetical protein
MKRVIVCVLALLLSWPVVSRAQVDDQDQQKTQYSDIEDGQLLKIVSYILTPVGMALEWGVTRPLHHAATQTPAKPLLSGDTEASFFNQNNNASQVPPGTFEPSPINPTNDYQVSSSEASVPLTTVASRLAPAQSIPPSKPLIQNSQPAVH